MRQLIVEHFIELKSLWRVVSFMAEFLEAMDGIDARK